MDGRSNISNDLFYKIRSRFSGLKLGTETGQITINPEEARFFDFDYKDREVAKGHITISLAEPNSMKVYFSSGITESMESVEKTKWYGFLKELRSFAKRRLMAFDTRDISKDNLDRRDFEFLTTISQPKAATDTIIKPVGESVMNESQLYGTNRVSYQRLMDTRLIIRHSKALQDDQQPGARSRNIAALFVENQDGERFKYPFIHLAGARAMQRHVANGGLPYDDIGKSIINMSEQIAQLKSFSNYVVRNDLMNSDTNSIVEKSAEALYAQREQIAKLSKQGYYENYKENFQEITPVEMPDSMMEEFKEKFTVRNFREEISTVFPLLYRLMQETNSVDYEDIVDMTTNEDINDEAVVEYQEDELEQFENWILSLGEGSAITSTDQGQQSRALEDLQRLVSEHFPAGVDGMNAIESLKGIIEDPQLFKQIKDQAKEDPDGCVRPLIKDWLANNAPEVVDQLDFGDMVDEPQMADVQYEGDIDPNKHPQTKDYGTGDDEDDLPFDPDPEDKPPSAKDEFGNTIKHRARHLARKGMRQAMGIKELAEFINSFYDRDSGTFPKGPEGVVTMVGKKFGEQAEQVARKFVERMAPHQEQGAEELAELGRMRELAGLQSEESQVSEGMRLSDEVGLALKEKGVKYSPEKEDEIIGMAVEVMKEMGIDKNTIRGYISYDEDFVPEMLDMLDREEKSEESIAPELEDSVSESQDDIYTINNPDMERDAGTGREEPDQIEVKVEFSSYDDEFEIDKVFRLDTKEDITDKVSNDRQLYFSLVHDVQQREQGRDRDYESIQDDATPELEAIKRLSGISQGLGL